MSAPDPAELAAQAGSTEAPAMEARYRTDLESIVANLPAAIPVPPLLRAFVGFVAEQDNGALGWFDALEGEPLDEHMLGDDEATRIARLALGLFLSLPDGSRLALWKHDEHGDPAVVLIESEGRHKTLASTLENFLLAWTRGASGVDELDDDEAGTARDALADWLRDRGVVAPKGKAPKAKLPSLSAYFKACLKEAKAARAAAAKPQGPTTRRVKPTLGTPTATSVVDVIPRALALLGKTITEPDVGAFFAALGIDVLGISKPDVLRNLVLPELGLQFEIAWPWEGGGARLEAAYPRAVRDDIQRAKARMFHAIQVLPEGYRSWNNGAGGFVTFKAFPGELPCGIHLTDTREALFGFGDRQVKTVPVRLSGPIERRDADAAYGVVAIERPQPQQALADAGRDAEPPTRFVLGFLDVLPQLVGEVRASRKGGGQVDVHEQVGHSFVLRISAELVDDRRLERHDEPVEWMAHAGHRAARQLDLAPFEAELALQAVAQGSGGRQVKGVRVLEQGRWFVHARIVRHDVRDLAISRRRIEVRLLETLPSRSERGGDRLDFPEGRLWQGPDDRSDIHGHIVGPDAGPPLPGCLQEYARAAHSFANGCSGSGAAVVRIRALIGSDRNADQRGPAPASAWRARPGRGEGHGHARRTATLGPPFEVY
jgi:hypothetical protein